MIIIGIDPGTSCGWAILRDGERLASGVWDLSSSRHEGGGMRYVRCRSYLSELLDAYDEFDVLVAYEEVARHRGTAAAHVYGGIVAVIQSECESMQVPYLGIPVGTIKKHATGKGNAGKPAMIKAALERWDHEVEDDNEADALWCASALLEEVSGG